MKSRPNPKLKICGVQTVDEARKLADMGVDFIGLNFVLDSAKRVSEEAAREIVPALESGPVKTVALFQNQPLEFVREVIRKIRPDYVQLHGEETGTYIEQIRTPVIKSITDRMTPKADFYLLDRKIQGQGEPVDVSLAREMVREHPGRVFLAGGLTPENLAGVLEQVRPFAVDIAGGVRTGGRIDFEKVAKVLEIVRRQP